MERNWLIRTSQNQILGPVAKQKLLEFVEKGALGLNDEVTSGNGYWFSLREKELVEKYLFGDVPQGYNPISESKSVLSKRDDPEKTASINTAPANTLETSRATADDGSVLPRDEDLAYPDITLIKRPSSQVEDTEITKLPKQEDLEFPDITIIASAPRQHFGGEGVLATQASSVPGMTQAKKTVVTQEKVELALDAGDILYPKDEDLDFPELEVAKKPVREKTSEFEFSVDTSKTQAALRPKDLEAVAAKNESKKRSMELESEEGLGELTLTIAQAEVKPKEVLKDAPLTLQKKSAKEPKEPAVPREPREEKLLHERKAKSTAKVPARENREVVSIENSPEPLKKRNDNYIFFILIILALILLAVFFYFREILNKPLPV